ncbi:hypothetical protein PR048_018071 [Dryococelus australis]|uniref:Endonuclease/exonuclease/phosphatase domain-containing protein n=1 Tax=Dryococelus australis TaxID=614101 RepID=A0ABQ9HBD4_9NEOP|nr:hypothetical protein PR048_018071 [Dryococelus australis]
MDEIGTLINTEGNVAIVAITESWMNSNETKYYNIEGYDSFFACRDVKIGGGTCIFVKRATWTDVLKDLIEEEHSLLHVQLDMFLQKIENLLRNVQSSYIIVIGDFNIDSLSNSKEMQDYSDLITMYGFYQVNTIFPTRCSKTTNSLIDHVLVNKTQYVFRICNIGSIDSCISDHNVIVSEVTTGINKKLLSRGKENESETDHRIKINYSNLNIYLEGKLCSDTLGSEEDSNRMYNELIRHIKTGYAANNTDCNTKKRKRYNINPIRETWVIQELIQIIHSRDTLQSKVKANPHNEQLKT